VLTTDEDGCRAAADGRAGGTRGGDDRGAAGREGRADGPTKVPDEQLRKLLGITTVNLVQGNKRLAVIDRPLAAT
jgi:hypothetical protein